MRSSQIEIMHRFDADGNGLLNDNERSRARAYARSVRGRRQGEQDGADLSGHVPLDLSDIGKVLLESAAKSPRYDAALYDEEVLRTIYLRFSHADWFEELEDFYRSDVEVPADLVMDGKLYQSVGVGFRGNSSYSMVRGEKKSFNISINYADGDQRLHGYRTLNLLNGHSDPSFCREVLFSRICRNYMPAFKANFVELVVNGESWGIYVNVQQFNGDFEKEWFGDSRGTRWKIPAGLGRNGGLRYLGSDPSSYKEAYRIKTEDSDESWQALIELTGILANVPDDTLVERLAPILDIDGALWFLALESVFLDGDGYLSRGSDYYLYRDSGGRFHLIHHDNNETFKYAGGGGPNMWMTSQPLPGPLVQAGNRSLPLINRLLGIPSLRARYLDHISVIIHDWLTPGKIAPIIDGYRHLIGDAVKRDQKKLYSYEAFLDSFTATDSGQSSGTSITRSRFREGRAPSLPDFAGARLAGYAEDPVFPRDKPVVRSLTAPSQSQAGPAYRVSAQVHGASDEREVILYYSSSADAPFEGIPMGYDAGDGTYHAEIPPFAPGTQIRYYVEAVSGTETPVSTLFPPGAEFGSYSYTVPYAGAGHIPVRVNELMAANTKALFDPQGEADDWIELYNTGNEAVDLSGLYLSDTAGELKKWKFPAGTTLPAKEFLLVWADEDITDMPGLHTDFKLSAAGESVYLVDRDENGNRILDTVTFGIQMDDVSFGRYPDGAGQLRYLIATPGSPNGR